MKGNAMQHHFEKAMWKQCVLHKMTGTSLPCPLLKFLTIL